MKLTKLSLTYPFVMAQRALERHNPHSFILSSHAGGEHLNYFAGNKSRHGLVIRIGHELARKQQTSR